MFLIDSSLFADFLLFCFVLPSGLMMINSLGSEQFIAVVIDGNAQPRKLYLDCIEDLLPLILLRCWIV